MEQDPYQPIKAKVDQIKLWHNFFFRYCYVFCRVIFVIAGAFVGAAAAPVVCYLFFRQPKMIPEAMPVAAPIGLVAGGVAGWYSATASVRFVKVLVFLANRIVNLVRRGAAHAGVEDNEDG